jgi:hypothetical protein
MGSPIYPKSKILLQVSSDRRLEIIRSATASVCSGKLGDIIGGESSLSLQSRYDIFLLDQIHTFIIILKIIH